MYILDYMHVSRPSKLMHKEHEPKLSTEYHKDPKFSDRKVWANSADAEEQSDLGLHYLLFHLHLFDEIPQGLLHW